jgi:nucleotide-binding universal stress UspA family protein
VTKAGAPADVIAAQATKSGADQLVMGAHGHGALANLMLGSVMTKGLARCRTRCC